MGRLTFSVTGLAMTIDYIFDHVARAEANLESQFQNSPNLKAVLRAIVGEVQALEDAIYSTTVDRFLENARGVQLDQYGRVLGAGRGGLSDNAYRQILSARILGNRSSGSIARLLDIYRILNGGGEVDVDQVYPNTLIFYALHPQSTTAEQRRRIRDWMRAAKKAGVSLKLIEAPDDYFGFFADPNALGFSQGRFAGAI